VVYGDEDVNREYTIPRGRHILVQDGERVHSGRRLCDGPIIPHDILKIQGVHAVEEYLCNEIQGVYRLQGVSINDKHIEIIVRQMLRKVRITRSGDTEFLDNDQVDRDIIEEENERVMALGLEPASFEPLLLGITKASLSTESFISAASFQETTKVLTNAALEGKIDTLDGLKENVIIGRIIPCGTGFKKHRKIYPLAESDENEYFIKVETETDEFGAIT